ncbi:hypothetical protein ADK60_31105 [Streptomyces sp. XY431]|nr:hypothetical protein ADK60_31105 [Streptomyces sp. XY431]
MVGGWGPDAAVNASVLMVAVWVGPDQWSPYLIFNGQVVITHSSEEPRTPGHAPSSRDEVRGRTRDSCEKVTHSAYLELLPDRTPGLVLMQPLSPCKQLHREPT